MSYPRLFTDLPTRRFVAANTARWARANYHGARIAELLALKLGTRPRAILPFLPRPLAREAAWAMSRGRPQSAVLFLQLLRAEEAGDE
ncbi:MAG TPA: hypothetical protein VEC14_04645 [Reyranellaceae bacterium]|nr:hypothetical protein [Reyranellaceae bacterium]